MKIKTLACLSFATVSFSVLCGSAHAQIAKWNFDSLTLSSTTTNGTTSLFNVPADVGSGTASGLHATSAGNIYSTPVGNGSPKSISANNWSVGDYFQFQSGTLGFTGIMLEWDQTGSATGPSTFKLSYSTDGSTFTQFGSDYTVLVNNTPNTWTSGTPVTATHFSVDLSSITALNNAPAVYFRVIDDSATAINGGAVGTAGTDRVDNFTIEVVPEPSSLFVLGGIGFLALYFKNRRK